MVRDLFFSSRVALALSSSSHSTASSTRFKMFIQVANISVLNLYTLLKHAITKASSGKPRSVRLWLHGGVGVWLSGKKLPSTYNGFSEK